MIDKALVVDDELLIRQLMEETIIRRGIEVTTAGGAEEAMEILDQEEFQIIFCDLKMAGKSGMDLLRHCVERRFPSLFVIMTAYGSVETAVEAMKLGAFDFIIKPFPPDQTDVIIEKARIWLGMNEKQRYLQNELVNAEPAARRPVGSSDAMKEVERLVRRVAPTDATVLVTGESGTGKELVASEINRISNPDGKNPYIRMNCAAVPENLLESEMFGHEKGAFTGAVERRVGRFELADKGILLLDEIGEIPLAMQAKLLRVLQESEFERVGGSKTVQVKVRVVATTNRDLRNEVDQGRFREDLYYRLNVFPIKLPPLRQRGGDAAEIACYLLDKQARKFKRPLRFHPRTLDIIRLHQWPGNIRELENVVERLAILEDGPIIQPDALPTEILRNSAPNTSDDNTQQQQHIPPINSETNQADNQNQPTTQSQAAAQTQTPDTPEEGEETLNLAEIERKTIFKALKQTSGNRAKAAELLGFTARTLRNKLNEYRRKGLDAPDFNDQTQDDDDS